MADAMSPDRSLEHALRANAGDARRLVVAYSGGADSTALLGLAAARQDHRRLLAVHVHHGWHERADDWAEHCLRVAADLGVRCRLRRVDAAPVAGEGPEAAARRARYATLAAELGPGDALLTAHHADDQAETVLLALLRGAGVRGLAAMPGCRPLGSGVHLRPFLRIPGRLLRARALELGLDWIEDPANADAAYDRVYVRREILPVLRRRWPGAAATLARTASLAGDSIGIEDALAARDHVACRGRIDGTLDVTALMRLTPERQRLLVRWWLRRRGMAVPPAPRLETLREQVAGAAGDRNPLVAWSGVEVRRWAGLLWALRPRPEIEPGAEFHWPADLPVLELPDRRLDRSTLDLPAMGIAADADVRIRYPYGGERVRLAGAARERALKDILRDAGVPPWERRRVPLLRVDGRLVAVIGIGRVVDAALD